MDQFENPPAELRGKPFWSWNGDLDKDELIRQIGIAKEMGMGGGVYALSYGVEDRVFRRRMV